jgi:hypothetical protein
MKRGNKALVICLILVLPIAYLSYKYFNENQDPEENWIDQLDSELKESILWKADHEQGNLNEWSLSEYQYPGGGIFNTGGGDVSASTSSAFAHFGKFSASATITNAIKSENGNKAVRLLRWTDTAWDNDGDYFPIECYFSTWILFPENYNPNKQEPWDPGDGGWWNIFQIKSDDEGGDSQPIWVLNVASNESNNDMYFYLYSDYNSPNSFDLSIYYKIPVREWIHLEMYVYQSKTNQGILRFWINGQLVFERTQVKTIIDGPVIWGIGNYTDHISGGITEGTATLYFDDSIISTKRISQFFK